ncbi:MAG: Qat anti-phage system associated protein QatB [Candidatus Acidiferrales bacterium]
MGTSNGNRGQDGRTPLIPSWLTPAPLPTSSPAPPQPPPNPPADDNTPPPPQGVPTPPSFPLLPALAAVDRFIAARNNFSRFVSSGGNDRTSLGRSLSHYVSTSSGGATTAAQRMGSSRTTGAQLLNFLSGTVANGQQATLRVFNLQRLAGKQIEEVFVGLIDYLCPEGGSLDEGIAREAFVETIVDLAESGVTELDNLTFEQMQTIFELYAAHAIEARLCNDIGAKAITMPTDAARAAVVQKQLLDFIRRSVSDALTKARDAITTLTPENVLRFVTQIYESAFSILRTLAEAEASA